MNIEKTMPILMAILMITIIALATSCSTNKVMIGNHYDHSKICPAYN